MKTLTGVITSLKTAQTAQVKTTRRWQHPIYKKYVKRDKAYACHYENMELELGQTVLIKEIPPKSKTKRFQVVEVVKA